MFLNVKIAKSTHINENLLEPDTNHIQFKTQMDSFFPLWSNSQNNNYNKNTMINNGNQV